MTFVPNAKIDDEATNGLVGVANSLAYRIHEVERHSHSYERWLQPAAVASGEVHVADRLGVGTGVFTVDAGNDTWGSWVQILGSNDTPADIGKVQYDLHRILVTEVEHANAIYYVQVGFGESADILTAGAYSELAHKPMTTQAEEFPLDIQTRTIVVGTKAWARCMAPTKDTSKFYFLIGLHEYEG